jgi:hypothetical protein
VSDRDCRRYEKKFISFQYWKRERERGGGREIEIKLDISNNELEPTLRQLTVY